MRILALDMATRTGWATWDDERRESGFVDFDVKRGESPGMRFVRFNRWLHETLEAIAPEIVVYEQAWGSMRSGAAAEVALGLSTRVLEACAMRGINHQPINGSTLKKWTTGRGNAKKPEMVQAVIVKFCSPAQASRFSCAADTLTNPLDDNEADAIALLEYAKAEVLPVSA